MTRLPRVLAGILAVSFALGLTAITASARDMALTDYGSGKLGDWTVYSHTLAGDPATADVALFGDSISVRGWPDLEAALAAKGKTLYVDAWSARPTAPAVDAALALATAGKLPRRIVMAVGTNDIYGPSVMAAQITRLKAGVPEGTEILWMDVQASRTSTSYSAATKIADQRNSGWVNIQIREQCFGNCKVIPWSVWFASAPSRLGTYLQDGVHPWMAAGTGHGDGTAFWSAVIMTVLTPQL